MGNLRERISKTLTESGEATLRPTKKSLPIPEQLMDRIGESDFHIQCTWEDDTIPIPWDAGFGIEGGHLILEGGAGPSGWGSALVHVPLEDDCGIEIVVRGGIDEQDIYMLRKLGWIVEAEQPAEGGRAHWTPR